MRGLEKDFLLNSFYYAETGGQIMAGGGGALGGLPPKIAASVAASVREIAKSWDPTATQLIQRAGFVQFADMNADGRTDYILDTSVTGSAFWCNVQSCAVRVFLSTPNGYQRNDFQAFNVVPAMFSCQGASCVKTDAPTTRIAIAPAQPRTLAPTTQASTPVPTAQHGQQQRRTQCNIQIIRAITNRKTDFSGAGQLRRRHTRCQNETADILHHLIMRL